jgi:predicted RNA-binding Zn ribbon-like protein
MEIFELIAGSVALDLVNTLDNRFRESGPEELLNTYGDLCRFAGQAGLLNSTAAQRLAAAPGKEAERSRVLTQVKELREALASVSYAFLDGKRLPLAGVALLGKYFKRANFARELTSGKGRLTWEWSDRENSALLLWTLALEAEEFLLSDRVERMRSCASGACRWLFLDTSKNHTRRWCKMQVCGNRMKARRFQARLAGD